MQRLFFLLALTLVFYFGVSEFWHRQFAHPLWVTQDKQKVSFAMKRFFGQSPLANSKLCSLKAIINQSAYDLKMEKVQIPIVMNKDKCDVNLELTLISWIERPFYGVTILASFTDPKTKNLLSEAGDNFKLGFVF